MAYVSQQSTILQNMITYLQDAANWADGIPKITDFSPGSIIYTLLSAISVAVDTDAYAIYMARQAAYISTAIGSDLDNKAADYGITRKAALASSGSFVFTKLIPSVSSTDIPIGTLISTLPDSNGNVITFATTADATLSAGQTTVTVNATCQILGSTGNLAANTALLVSSAVPGIDGVELLTSITNGVVTETDDSLRARTLAAFASLATGTLAWYQETALSVAGIQSATVVPQNRGPGTVDVFIVGENNTIPSTTLQSQVQAVLNAGRPITDDAKEQTPTALIANATIQIHLLSGYDSTIASNSVQTAVTNYINNLGTGAGSIGYIYASQLISTANSIAGVANATTAFADTAVSQYQLPQAGTITVTTF